MKPVSGLSAPQPISSTSDTFIGDRTICLSDFAVSWAVSAMLPSGEGVTEYLEGGGKSHDGRRLPLAAAPTTAGTGSEATKNAVLSCVGENGFKKSLRHDNFIPDLAVVDPELTLSCPPGITAACGMDAITQLIESFVSIKSSPLTDALAISGLSYASQSLLRAYENGEKDKTARAGMALAACLSGITLAHAGLGVIHGFGASVGGRFPVPHGVLCGNLLAPVVRQTVRKLKENGDRKTLEKFASIAGLFGKGTLADTLSELTEKLDLPRLSRYGLTEKDLPGLARMTENKNYPVPLSAGEREAALRERL